MVEVVCRCGTMLSLPDEYAGKRGKCPACGAVVNIPAAASSVDDAAPPPIQHPPLQSAPVQRAPVQPAQVQPVAAAQAVAPRPIAPRPVAPPPAVAAPRPPVPVTLPQARLGEVERQAAPAVSAADIIERIDPRHWPLSAKISAGGVAAVLMLLVIFALTRRLGGTPAVDVPAVAAALAPPSASNSKPTSTERPAATPTQPKPASTKQASVTPSQPVEAPSTPQLGSVQQQPSRVVKSTPPRTPPKTIGRPGDLTGGSREYDDLHCQRIQSQHAVRVPAAATMIEVDGERLPLANLPHLAESPTPLVFLPRGTHAVRFRQGEQAVMVKIDSDLSQVYQDMRRYFDVSGAVQDKELFSRGARAMDVHRAPFLLNLMGATHLKNEQWEAAERKFRRSLRVNPLFAPAHLNLAVALAHRKAQDEAIREVELADACNVGNAFGLSAGVAEVRRRLGMQAGARTASDVELVSYVNSASLSEDDVRITALLKGMSKYAVREEDRGKILNNLAVHFADTGRTELALDHFRSALAVIKTAGPERFALARQVLSHMSDACRKANFDEADEYQAMQGMVGP